ncbi:hypothetical protein [Mediterraneibacter gnavus]|jgi:transcriptional regulator with XRE-family HTH domain|uniref:hypothetical protein n=2 Tax=Mediterraneibacter gnavus TaxID=33038 RepID=UPI000E550BDA|nr:hypothetical protein [Mediterraneibacter gnavus]RHM41258.1 hypothetical protein DWZ70_01840 [Mediterraneibacter gnavus]
MYNDIKAGIYETLLRGCSKEDEDSIIKDLLETNIRQRGDIGGSAKKVGRRIMELERLYEIQLGGNRGNQYVVAEPNNSVLATQSDLAAKLGMSVDTLQNYKMLADMIPELEEHQKRHVLFIAEVIMVNKESGNVTDKKTKQQLAEELNINVKTMRNAGRYIEYIENIEKNIGEEKAEKLNDIIYNLQKNKKENVSYEQIKQLSMALPEEQIRIVDLIIRVPQNAKQIINNALPLCRTKITVTLPSFINEWYDYKAMHSGVSKSKYIEQLLIKFMDTYSTDNNF